MRRRRRSWKIYLNFYFGASRSFKGIDVDTSNKISYACCLAQSYGISSQFTIEMCVPAKKIAKKITKTAFIKIQSRLRLPMLTNLKSPSPVLVIISCMSGLILTCLEARSCFSCLEIWNPCLKIWRPVLEKCSNMDERFILMLTWNDSVKHRLSFYVLHSTKNFIL